MKQDFLIVVTPCIPVVPKPVIYYLLLWQLVAITQVFFPHELKCIFPKRQHVEMGPVLPFLLQECLWIVWGLDNSENYCKPVTGH